MKFKSIIGIIFTLLILVGFSTRAYSQQGSGAFVVNTCSSGIHSPVPYYSWCFEGSSSTLKMWNGTVWQPQSLLISPTPGTDAQLLQYRTANGYWTPFTSAQDVTYNNTGNAAVNGATGGLNSTGSITSTRVGTPNAPSISSGFTSGTTDYYFCVAGDKNASIYNFTSVPSTGTGTTGTTGVMSCGGQAGALKYYLLRTSSSTVPLGQANTLVGSCTPATPGVACTISDAANSLTAFFAQNTDMTGAIGSSPAVLPPACNGGPSPCPYYIQFTAWGDPANQVTAIGAGALYHLNAAACSTGSGGNGGCSDTAVGDQALYNTIGSASLGSGANNVAIGFQALFSNVYGANNVAMGNQALASNISTGNTAVGESALESLNGTDPTLNTAIGYQSMLHATTAYWSVAVGGQSLVSDTTGAANTAVGFNTLANVTTGNSNVAIGQNTIGTSGAAIVGDTAVGSGALNLVTGSYNTAIGLQAGDSVTSGATNIFAGYQAGSLVTSGSNNIIIGQGSNNITIGSGNILIGNTMSDPVATTDNQIDIGDTIFGIIGGQMSFAAGIETGDEILSRAQTEKLAPGLFVGCGACSAGTAGTKCAITDDNTACAFSAIITGSGTHKVLGYCDGINWVMATCE
jgi:hypothetical protein